MGTHRIVGVALGVVMAAATLAPVSAAEPPDLSWTLNSGARREEAIQTDILFRKGLKFRSGRGYVESLYEDPSKTIGTRVAGALFTKAEFEELKRRDRLGDDGETIEDYYNRHAKAAGDFGGVAIDHAAGGVLAVYLKKGAPTPWKKGLKYPDSLRIRTTTTSYMQLRALQDKINVAMTSGEAGLERIVSTGVSVMDQAVIVGLDSNATASQRSKASETLSSRFGAKRINTVIESAGKLAAGLKGGWSYYPAGCSLGFKVDKSNAGDPNDRWYISAGHCSSLETMQYHSGKQIGPAKKRNWWNGGKGDALLIRVDDSTGGGKFTAAAKVVRKYQGTAYVLDVKAKSSHIKGKSRCMTGRVTKTTCGLVGNKNKVIRTTWGGNPNFYVHDLVEVTNIIRTQGDSGGSAFWHNWDNNTVKASGTLSIEDSASARAYYTPISRFEAYNWHITLATLANSDGCRIPGVGGPSPKCPIDGGGDY